MRVKVMMEIVAEIMVREGYKVTEPVNNKS